MRNPYPPPLPIDSLLSSAPPQPQPRPSSDMCAPPNQTTSTPHRPSTGPALRRPWSISASEYALASTYAYSAYAPSGSSRLDPRLDPNRRGLDAVEASRRREEWDPSAPESSRRGGEGREGERTRDEAERPEWSRAGLPSRRARERSQSPGTDGRSRWSEHEHEQQDRRVDVQTSMPPPLPISTHTQIAREVEDDIASPGVLDEEGIDYKAVRPVPLFSSYCRLTHNISHTQVLRTYTRMLHLLPVVLHDEADPIAHDDLRELVAHAIRGYDLLSVPVRERADGGDGGEGAGNVEAESPCSTGAASGGEALEDDINSDGELNDAPSPGRLRDCLGCGAKDTPEWRRGPLGPRTLCNACVGCCYGSAKKACGGELT